MGALARTANDQRQTCRAPRHTEVIGNAPIRDCSSATIIPRQLPPRCADPRVTCLRSDPTRTKTIAAALRGCRCSRLSCTQVCVHRTGCRRIRCHRSDAAHVVQRAFAAHANARGASSGVCVFASGYLLITSGTYLRSLMSKPSQSFKTQRKGLRTAAYFFPANLMPKLP